MYLMNDKNMKIQSLSSFNEHSIAILYARYFIFALFTIKLVALSVLNIKLVVFSVKNEIIN